MAKPPKEIILSIRRVKNYTPLIIAITAVNITITITIINIILYIQR